MFFLHKQFLVSRLISDENKILIENEAACIILDENNTKSNFVKECKTKRSRHRHLLQKKCLEIFKI